MQRDPKIEMITAVHPFDDPRRRAIAAPGQSRPRSPKAARSISRATRSPIRANRHPGPILPPPGHLRLSARSALALRPLETVAAGEGGSARAIARAGEWRKAFTWSSPKAARPGWIRRTMPGRSSASCSPRRGDRARLVPDEIYFCHRRCGQFVRQRPRGGLARHAARTARSARPPAKVRPLPERRSRDDEPVSARRSLCPERRRRDRSRPRPLRALHQLRPLAEQQPDQRTGLRERHSKRAPRRLSRQNRAGHSARHRRNQGAHPPGGRSGKGRRRHHRNRRHGRRHRRPALSRSDPPIHPRSRRAQTSSTCTSRSCPTSARRAN